MALRKLGAAAVIRDKSCSVLLVKHTYGRLNWEIPGGGSEEHESIEETALREVREETGLLVHAERATGVYYDPDDDMHHFVFLCRVVDDRMTPRADRGEISDIAFFPPDSLREPISHFTVQRIRDALTDQSYSLPVVFPSHTWWLQ